MTVIERADGAKVDAADEATGRMVRFGSLVDVDAGQDFGWIGVELDCAAVVAGGLLTTVQGRRGEVRAEATDGDDAGATMVALGSEARQASDRLTDAVVR